MKPPVRVWVRMSDGHFVTAYSDEEARAGGLLEDDRADSLHPYRLDTPKRVPPSRPPVAGGVVRKKRKAKRGRK